MLGRVQSEGVRVNAILRCVRPVLVRLDVVEVLTLSLGESIVTVQLNLALDDRVKGTIEVKTEVVPLVDADIAVSTARVKGVGGTDEASEESVNNGGELTDGQEIASHEDVVQGSGTETDTRGRGSVTVNAGTGDNGTANSDGASATNLDHTVTIDIDGTRSTSGVGDGKQEALGGLNAEVTDLISSAALVVINASVSKELLGAGEPTKFDNPEKGLGRVVEVKADLAGVSRQSLLTSELKLLDQVLVRGLGEALALLRVEVDVVDKKLSLVETESKILDGDVLGDNTLISTTEVEVDTDVVVLEGDERKGKTVIPVAEELQRNIQQGGIVVAVESVQLLGVTDHDIVTTALADRQGKLLPDGKPLTVLAVNTRTTNAQLDLINKGVADTANPSPLLLIITSVTAGQDDTKVHLGDQITITGDRGRDTTTEVWVTREGLLDSLDGKVGVSAVDNLEESNLRVTSQVNILGTIGDKLHKSSSHFAICI